MARWELIRLAAVSVAAYAAVGCEPIASSPDASSPRVSTPTGADRALAPDADSTADGAEASADAGPVVASVDASTAVAEPTEPLGTFQLSYYWITTQTRRRGDRTVAIYDTQCKTLARVRASFARRLALEGTGRLHDGRLLNAAGRCDCEFSPCFFEVPDTHVWGVGVKRRALTPFRSVAVDHRVVPIGTRLFVPALEGLRMPGHPPDGGFVHDGCVIADDRGGGVRGRHLDFFVGLRGYYRAIHGKHRLTSVNVFSGTDRCADLGEGREGRS